MRLEQRIGRVDRIGQPNTVRAINFVFEELGRVPGARGSGEEARQ